MTEPVVCVKCQREIERRFVGAIVTWKHLGKPADHIARPR